MKFEASDSTRLGGYSKPSMKGTTDEELEASSKTFIGFRGLGLLSSGKFPFRASPLLVDEGLRAKKTHNFWLQHW